MGQTAQLNIVETTEPYELSALGEQNKLFAAHTQAGLRLAVEERAQAFGCQELISRLRIIDAVRFLQQKEQYTPCFGWDAPLVPISEDTAAPPGVDKEKLCGVFECYWRIPCDVHRMMTAATREKRIDEEFVRNMDETICRTEFDSATDIHHVVEEPAEFFDVASPTGHADRVADQKSHLLQQEAPSVKGDSLETRSGEEETVAGILSQLAESATAFLSAIQSLARQSASSNSAVRQQLDRLQGSFDQLAGVVSGEQQSRSASQEKYEQLSAAVASVRVADAHQEAEVRILREEVRERTDSVSGRLENLSARVVQHQEEFSQLHAKVESLLPLHSVVSDLSSQMTVWSERLNQQEGILHSLCQMQNHRAAALQQFCEVLARLETSALPPSAVQ